MDGIFAWVLSQWRYKMFLTTSTIKAKRLFLKEKPKPAHLLLYSCATLIRASVPLTEGIAAVGKLDKGIYSLPADRMRTGLNVSACLYRLPFRDQRHHYYQT